MEFSANNLEETAKIAQDFCKSLKPKNTALVVGFYGELGSGKTTFIKYLADCLGIKETVQSPTFVIMKRYEIRSTSNEVRKDLNYSNLEPRTPNFDFLIHIDAYRIESDEEMLNLGWFDMVADPKNIICVEWPEKISGIMPSHTKIYFEHVSENERKIKIQNEE